MKNELRQSICLKNIPILGVLCPYVNLGSEAAMAVNHMSNQVFNCKEMLLLADVFSVYPIVCEVLRTHAG